MTGKAALDQIMARFGPDSRRARALRWLTAWREVAELTFDIPQAAVVFPAVITALDQCDAAFAADNWRDFQAAAALVRTLVAGQ